MAVFNPQVQAGQVSINSTEFKPISDPKIVGDTSGGQYLKSFGDALQGGVELADQGIKMGIDKDVRSKVEGIRNDFTSDLEAYRTAQYGVDPSGRSRGVPAAIDSGLGKVDAVQQALINGKINDTYYTQRLKSAVTDLRAQYPGYVDYIDKRVSQITGFDPANAYIQNLQQDINKAQSSKKSEYDKVLDIARKAVGDLPNAEQQYNRLLADPSYQQQFMQWYSSANAGRIAIEADNLARTNRRGRKDEIVADDTEKFTNLVSTNIKTHFDSTVSIAGVETPGGILKFVESAAANPDKYSGAAFEQLATQMTIQRNNIKNQLLAASNKTENGVPSYTSTIGTKARDEIINSQLAAYDGVIDALKNKDAGLAFYHMNQSRAIMDDRKSNMLAGPAGQDIATFKVLQDTMGPQWTSIVVNEGLRKNIDEKIRPLFNQSATVARAQPNFDGSGRPVTFKQQEAEAIRLEKEGKMSSEMRARYTGNLINIVDDLKDPRAPEQAKINVVKYLFSPEGQGILNKIKVDYTDPDTGKFVPGKYSVWTRFSSPDIVAAVAKLPAESRNMYRNYMEREAGAELYYKEFQNLNRMTGHDNISFKYNDGGKGGVPQITSLVDGKPIGMVRDVPGQWQTGGGNSPTYLKTVQETTNRVNEALAGMHRIESAFGGNASDRLLSFLINSQVDLGKNWEGLPASLMDAIAASRKSRKLEDTFKEQGKK